MTWTGQLRAAQANADQQSARCSKEDRAERTNFAVCGRRALERQTLSKNLAIYQLLKRGPALACLQARVTGQGSARRRALLPGGHAGATSEAHRRHALEVPNRVCRVDAWNRARSARLGSRSESRVGLRDSPSLLPAEDVDVPSSAGADSPEKARAAASACARCRGHGSAPQPPPPPPRVRAQAERSLKRRETHQRAILAAPPQAPQHAGVRGRQSGAHSAPHTSDPRRVSSPRRCSVFCGRGARAQLTQGPCAARIRPRACERLPRHAPATADVYRPALAEPLQRRRVARASQFSFVVRRALDCTRSLGVVASTLQQAALASLLLSHHVRGACQARLHRTRQAAEVRAWQPLPRRRRAAEATPARAARRTTWGMSKMTRRRRLS